MKKIKYFYLFAILLLMIPNASKLTAGSKFEQFSNNLLIDFANRIKPANLNRYLFSNNSGLKVEKDASTSKITIIPEDSDESFFGPSEVLGKKDVVKQSESWFRRFTITFLVSMSFVWALEQLLLDQLMRNFVERYPNYHYSLMSEDNKWLYLFFISIGLATVIAVSDLIRIYSSGWFRKYYDDQIRQTFYYWYDNDKGWLIDQTELSIYSHRF